MASSGSGSRKGFPEAGGKHCKPQGQEDMLSLKGHRSDCFPSEEYSQCQAQNQGKATGALMTDTACHFSLETRRWNATFQGLRGQCLCQLTQPGSSSRAYSSNCPFGNLSMSPDSGVGVRCWSCLESLCSQASLPLTGSYRLEPDSSGQLEPWAQRSD